MDLLDLYTLERADSLFVAPRAEDVPLSCPARVHAEAERGRRVLVLALFEPAGSGGGGAEAVRRLGAVYRGGGLRPVSDHRSRQGDASAPAGREPEEEETLAAAATLLEEIGQRVEAVHIYAPLGLAPSLSHDLAYEASVRAFATGMGRNLFLYEERPDAFVPGAVRTRLALLGARLPPAGQGAVGRGRLSAMLWRANEPNRLRGDAGGLRARLDTIAVARRRWRSARAWNPLRALGPRLQPIIHAADEETRALAGEAAELVLPRDRKGHPRAARRFTARAARAARALGAPYHAERLWLFLPSGEGLHEVRHALDAVAD